MKSSFGYVYYDQTNQYKDAHNLNKIFKEGMN